MTQPSYSGNTSERLHALDNLRAVMMWLGIVLHAAAIYTVQPTPIPWRDQQSSLIADVLVVLIHSFRMPVFFILAGFFVALLVQKRGLRSTFKNRLLRLGAPFALLWPPIFVCTGVLAMLFMHRAVRGTWGIDEALVPHVEGTPKFNTMHLWFIWMLLWLSVATVLVAPLARMVPPVLSRWLSQRFAQVASNVWGLGLLALPLALIGAGYKDGVVTPQGSFLPPLSEWLHNGLFYVFGLALYAQRARLLAYYSQRWARHTAIGLLFFVGPLVLTLMPAQHESLATIPYYTFWSALVYNLCTWFWSVSIVGIILHYVHRLNPLLRYLSQASYWVYLVHLPLTIGFGALLYGAQWSALAKLVINITATSAVSLLSYHLLVRSTRLGALLTGQRHPFSLFGARSQAAAAFATSPTSPTDQPRHPLGL